MKRLMLYFTISFAIIFGMVAEDIVILHTNDTHSNIEPDSKGRGGILQRKALVDSVRKSEKNVLLVDAGDMVQGTLYFKYFKGDVEYPLFNMMDYDVRILGNHEFDNGLEELARHWKDVKGARLSANYNFDNTAARGIFEPYTIKKIGKHKIGFLGINIDPESIVSRENYEGMQFTEPVITANAIAEELRHKGCDLVVAVTHIGYESDNDKPDDRALAAATKGIDIIIGGHSHTTVSPDDSDRTPHWFMNADGKRVLVAQTGKYGANLGYIKVNLDRLGDRDYEYKLIPVTDRFADAELDKRMAEHISPYREKVDSINNVVVGYSRRAMANVREAGPYANWAGDFGQWYGERVADSIRSTGKEFPQIDMSIMNVGGIRQPMPEGKVSQGLILSAFPFSNRMRIISIKGKELLATMRIVAPKGGEAISKEAKVVTDGKGGVVHFLINGEDVDSERDYVVATIDYIAEGNDDMTPMARHKEIWRDNEEVSVRILEYMDYLTRHGLAVDPDTALRFVEDATLEFGDE